MRKALEAFVEQYQLERLRDLQAAFTRLDTLSRRVASLRDKLTPMREVLERLSLLSAVLREAIEQRGEAEPEVLRTIADNTEVQLDEISRELGALAEWLRVLGGKKGGSAAVIDKLARREPEGFGIDWAAPRTWMIAAIAAVVVASAILLFWWRAHGAP
jgi:hypothetical protein